MLDCLDFLYHALDVIHRPFYGGAVVDDRDLAGDLFYSNKNDTCTLQWVHDLGGGRILSRSFEDMSVQVRKLQHQRQFSLVWLLVLASGGTVGALSSTANF
jgi:hypothetical protein